LIDEMRRRLGHVAAVAGRADAAALAGEGHDEPLAAARAAIGLPPGPGLGVEVDEKLLAEEAAKPQTYKWPGGKLKDGSVADY
jgi:hypothetical protein